MNAVFRAGALGLSGVGYTSIGVYFQMQTESQRQREELRREFQTQRELVAMLRLKELKRNQ
jgi:hypothetical protein